MSWHLGFQGAPLIDSMSSPFPQQKCTMLSQMLNKLISLHALLFRLETFAQPLHNVRFRDNHCFITTLFTAIPPLK